jgi:hypothetical protein
LKRAIKAVIVNVRRSLGPAIGGAPSIAAM